MSYKPLRLAVTGLKGQVVRALIEVAPREIEIIALGRPQLELSQREAVFFSLRHARCDAIINAAAYTQVDKAESEPELALRVNGEGAGYVAQAAADLDIPLIHLSTDYVFDGELNRPYRESDDINPINVYGQSKLLGEQLIQKICAKHVILRTSWIYSPFGANFVKTMLRLGLERDEVNVVADQVGNPTYAIDIANALFKIAIMISTETSSSSYGIFHMSGGGEASWAQLAEHIFITAESYGRKTVKVFPISAKDYPTAAVRPRNSRLDNTKLETIYGIKLPGWKDSAAICVGRLLKNEKGLD